MAAWALLLLNQVQGLSSKLGLAATPIDDDEDYLEDDDGDDGADDEDEDDNE